MGAELDADLADEVREHMAQVDDLTADLRERMRDDGTVLVTEAERSSILAHSDPGDFERRVTLMTFAHRLKQPPRSPDFANLVAGRLRVTFDASGGIVLHRPLRATVEDAAASASPSARRGAWPYELTQGGPSDSRRAGRPRAAASATLGARQSARNGGVT